jgi:hypothetical protein
MGMQGFLNLEGEDFAAFVIAALAGFAAGNLFGDSSWSVYVSILVSYHLFLAWVVFNQSGRAGLAMPVWMTALTHAACMVVALGPAVVSTEHHTLGFGLFRYAIAGLAIFETGWLFSKEEYKPHLDEVEGQAPVASDIRVTAEDEVAWLDYLRTRRPGMTKPGTTIRQERDAWMRARLKNREASQPKPEARPEATEPAETGDSPVYLAG